MVRITNISNSKIISFGRVNILPGETREIPKAYENSPVIEVYRSMGFAIVEDDTPAVAIPAVAADADGANADANDADAEDKAGEDPKATDDGPAEPAASEADAAEALRQARLASLKGISEEDLGALAKQMGINPAECKDQKDVLAAVKKALKK